MQERLDFLIPKSLQAGEPEQIRRAKLLILISMISGATCFGFAWPNIFFWDLPQSAMLLFVGTFIFVFCVPALFYITGSLQMAGHIMGFFGTVMLSADAALFSGGIYASTMTWFVVPPMFVSMIAGVRAGLVWTGVAIVSVFVIWRMEPPTPEVLQGLRPPPFEHAAVFVGILVFAAMLFVFYDGLQSEARSALQVSNKELTIARDEARSASRAKSVFVAGISHELRTPLTSIRSNVEILNAVCDSEETRSRLHALFVASDSLQHLLEDLLDLSTMDSQGVNLKEEALEVRGLHADVLLIMGELAKAKSLDLTGEVSDDVAQIMVGDIARVRQILLNLVSNALKFTETGRVNLSVKMAEVGVIQFAVKDTGIGISKADQELIFESFRQVVQGTTRQFAGVGMGLAVNVQLVEAMKGRIFVESSLGEGSTFFVELPFVEGHLPKDEIVESAMEQTTLKKALLVEDHDLNRELLLEMLRLSGCEAVGTRDAKEALVLLEAQQFDVILMDLHMPGKDGAQLTREWRKSEAKQGRTPVRIVGISADVRLEERKRCALAGMNDFLGKPFSLKDLKAMLDA